MITSIGKMCILGGSDSTRQGQFYRGRRPGLLYSMGVEAMPIRIGEMRICSGTPGLLNLNDGMGNGLVHEHNSVIK
jgi:hypothetical protein